jgi:tRNA (guanine37-N1)-methyltransferase
MKTMPEAGRAPQLDVGMISLIPEWVAHMKEHGVTGRAITTGHVRLRCWNPRDYTTNKQRKIDDKPYGGGPGMVMQAEPLLKAIGAASEALGEQLRMLYFSPQGKPLRQSDITALAQQPALLLIAGRYEGVDERALQDTRIEQWSMGDFVTSGGELPALCCLDAIVRLLPNVLGNAQSTHNESFSDQLLEHPHYTRPPVYNDMAVPEVLLEGDHEAIARWRLQQSLARTFNRRPDLLETRGMNDKERQLLDEYLKNSVQ